MNHVSRIARVLCVIAATGVQAEESDTFHVDEQPNRLIISRAGRPVVDLVFQDEKIKRPYFANVHAPGGTLLTRHHPPKPDVDAVDHDAMHPGIWLAFGDINGQDFWRNKARIEHLRFLQPPKTTGNELTFSTESRLMTAANEPLCGLTQDYLLKAGTAGDLLIWRATFQPSEHEIVFGDQEEMGFGMRLATPLIEKNGGRILNSHGLTTAAKTWGQAAAWCDYSGTIEGRPAGLTCLTGPDNFRNSWWHNRDYGLMVANPFGRAAMKQGAVSSVSVKPHESLRLDFAACLHDDSDYHPEAAYAEYLQILQRMDAR